MRPLLKIAALVWPVLALAAETPAPPPPAAERFMKNMKGGTVYEIAAEAGYFIQTATRSTNLSERLEAAEAGLWLARNSPQWMQQQLSGAEGSVGPQANSALFELLADSVEDKVKKIIIPPLHPRLSLNDSKRDASPRDAASVQYMTRRREMYAEFCTLALKQPEWAENVLPWLTDAWLMDGKPTQEEMRGFLTEAVAACEAGKTSAKSVPQILGWWFQHGFARRYSDEQRVKLLGLALPFGAVALREARSPNGRPMEFLNLIADETQLHPGQRCELMEELWRLAREDAEPLVRRSVFPYWASYQFDLSDDISACLYQSGEFKADAQDPYLLKAVISACHTEYSRFPIRLPQHLKLAKFIDDILFERPDLLTDKAAADSVAVAASRLRVRSASAETQPLLQHAAEARARLLEHLVGHAEASPEALFCMLGAKVVERKDTRELEKQLLAMVLDKPGQIEAALKQFIDDANGTWKKGANYLQEGFLGGCWDLRQRNAWLAAALRIGKEVSRVHSKQWMQSWMSVAARGNWLAVPAVPGLSEWEFANRNSPGRGQFTYPAAELLRAREDLFLEGEEIQLSLGFGDFGVYASLYLSRVPPEPAPVLRMLRQNPARLTARLHDVIQSTYGTTDARLAAAAIVESFLKEWPEGKTDSEWLTPVHGILLGGEIPLVKGTRWDSNLRTTCDVQHALPESRTRHAALLRIVDQAMKVPALEPRVFADFAQYHLTDQPDLVVASCERVLKEAPQLFHSELMQVFKYHEVLAPPARRLEWARLFERLVPALKTHSATATLHSEWMDSFSIYCRIRNTAPKEPEWEELGKKMSQVVTAIATSTPLTAQTLNEYAGVQFARGASSEAVLKEISAIIAADISSHGTEIGKIAQETWKWRSRLTQGEGTTRERLWGAEIMLGMGQACPPDKHAAWLDYASSLLAFTAEKDPASVHTSLGMQLKLINLATSRRQRLGNMLWYLGITEARSGAVPHEYEQACQKLLADPREASETLRDCWKTFSNQIPEITGSMPMAEVALRVLKRWPDDAPVESYEWTNALLSMAGDRHSWLADRADTIGVKRKITSPLPATDPACAALQTSVLAELQRRNAELPWMPALRLRRAWRSHESLRDFFAATRREATMNYLNEVMSFELRNPVIYQNNRNTIQSADQFAPHSNAQEMMDATRIILAARSENLLDAETSSKLLTQASRSLQRVIELGQEVEKVCTRARVKNGTWAGAVHPAQKKEAEELKKTLDALTDVKPH